MRADRLSSFPSGIDQSRIAPSLPPVTNVLPSPPRAPWPCRSGARVGVDPRQHRLVGWARLDQISTAAAARSSRRRPAGAPEGEREAGSRASAGDGSRALAPSGREPRLHLGPSRSSTAGRSGRSGRPRSRPRGPRWTGACSRPRVHDLERAVLGADPEQGLVGGDRQVMSPSLGALGGAEETSLRQRPDLHGAVVARDREPVPARAEHDLAGAAAVAGQRELEVARGDRVDPHGLVGRPDTSVRPSSANVRPDTRPACGASSRAGAAVERGAGLRAGGAADTTVDARKNAHATAIDRLIDASGAISAALA